ncbi:MAG: glucan biosynthesis protein G [Paracoccus sp. (in: a-proteobacteria)]|uniref:glucan biosynthesis protein n=1 Tax=Paracoccus sp. TaxID=267 RepID=UPI0026E03F09|nr:glucan biosynthesis protein G [Paracoccus sp. (in: a-proteobacteria)]MDO5621314.1 glucan biosynthesis protein G [Paracoccus sp. (in: a-proteobacteria)]
MNRRHFLSSATALAGFSAATGLAQAQSPAADFPALSPQTLGFGFDSLTALARERAAAPFQAPKATLTGSFADLNYDQYRAIRFRREMDPWTEQDDFAVDLLPPGGLFSQPVKINLVVDGAATPLDFSAQMLDFDPSQFPDGADLENVGNMGWSGFRIRTRLNRPDVMDEFLVFQGASYFRAVARNTLYGLSARGLAIGTGSPAGEEFPTFTDFWLHRPEPGADGVLIYALLDSQSVAGAFEFYAVPGAETVLTTRLALFPRRDVRELGIAPLTSMFWFGPANRSGVDDYREAVHDSDGLQMTTGAGQQLWRVLENHRNLQMSAFMDRDPKGFGLIQRSRRFEDFQDAEARYEKRPSAWIEPEGDWGEGVVSLVEIPVANEFNDNIVSFWRPKAGLKAGQRFDAAYRLVFAPLAVPQPPRARIVQTRSGKSVNGRDSRSYVIDFDLRAFGDTDPEARVSASAGVLGSAQVQRLPEYGVMRLSFEFRPESASLADISAVLNGPDGALSETWVARWTL